MKSPIGFFIAAFLVIQVASQDTYPDYKVGTNHTVTWTYTGMQDFAIDLTLWMRVENALIMTPGDYPGTLGDIAKAVPICQGSFVWSISQGDYSMYVTRYWIRFTSSEDHGDTFNATSDYFLITPNNSTSSVIALSAKGHVLVRLEQVHYKPLRGLLMGLRIAGQVDPIRCLGVAEGLSVGAANGLSVRRGGGCFGFAVEDGSV
ncbi:hypothetical protein BC938DRAFT_479928 [Jimgerdemannia flammicorona]|uniref:Uncharacterized protein n=1 Tax=Jimgerdemannia flammicorona TaxID=994334 RepID=A0A433QJS4_9FUNG|nr:hypothetical protein BC938DRAFT_479928 [Jimgerdemannia flammicorona]